MPATNLGETGPLSQGGVKRVGRRSGYSRVLHDCARCGGAEEEAQGVQVNPLNPGFVSPGNKLLGGRIRIEVRVELLGVRLPLRRAGSLQQLSTAA